MRDVTLEKIGTLLDGTEARDAVHIAVLPVIAGEALACAEPVRVYDGVAKRAQPGETALGLVDPYLREGVKVGMRCYVFLYPGTITSLRHEWTHPALADVPDHVARRALDLLGGEYSVRWLRQFAALHAHSYERLVEEATALATTGRGSIGTRMNDDPSDLLTPEFWEHIKRVTGITAIPDTHDTRAPFACSC